MVVFKVAPVIFLILVVRAEKKIELQDIEEDNLKSEKQKNHEPSDLHSQNGSEKGIASNFLTNTNFFRYFDNLAQTTPNQSPHQLSHQSPHQSSLQSSHQSPHQVPYQPRFHHQYAVTELPTEHVTPVEPKVQYSRPTQQPQQAMVGYLSNVPMQIYLVPQYYNEIDHKANVHAGIQYTNGVQYTTTPQHSHAATHVPNYSTAPEAVQTQTNYIEVPSYVAPKAKNYVPQYPTGQQVTYLTYNTQPSVAVVPTVAPVVEYQVPVVQYSAAVVAPQPVPKPYYQTTRYQDTNGVEDCKDDCPKQYSHTEVSFSKAPTRDYHRYNARIPTRDEYRYNQIKELPHPSPLLLKGSPSHLAHIPKAFPMYRPLNKPVYGGPSPPGALVARPPTEHVVPFKRRPTSLLDSYIPSSVQIEYMKRGLVSNDPLQAYEALSSGNHFSHAHAPKQFERGFLPNQMYHTAVGGVTFGHYKRTPKVPQNY